MRTNIYSQEIDLDTDPQIVMQTAMGIDGDETFYGVRFYLHSAPQLHNTENDDDRSAVTFWLPKSGDNKRRVAALFNDAYHIIVEVISKVELCGSR